MSSTCFLSEIMLILKAIKSHFKRSYDKQSLILSSLQLVLCRVAAVKRLPLRHHNADYSFWFFRIIGLIIGQFENRIFSEAGARGRGQCCTITLCI